MLWEPMPWVLALGWFSPKALCNINKGAADPSWSYRGERQVHQGLLWVSAQVCCHSAGYQGKSQSHVAPSVCLKFEMRSNSMFN